MVEVGRDFSTCLGIVKENLLKFLVCQETDLQLLSQTVMVQMFAFRISHPGREESRDLQVPHSLHFITDIQFQLGHKSFSDPGKLPCQNTGLQRHRWQCHPSSPIAKH